MINVTKTYLPPLEEYLPYLRRIWKSGWVTNHGELTNELELKLKEYLNVNNLLVVNNGTSALQLAIRVLDLKDSEVITTPYSYVATLNALLWEGAIPVMADINQDSYSIDPNEIIKKITPKTKAILSVHVYGIPAHVNQINEIAKNHNLKVIYDAAHTFGTQLDGKHLAQIGDIVCYSFHATKPFHSIEGGALVFEDDELASKVNWMRRFGHLNDLYFGLGINAKISELHAAMGLIMLKKFRKIIAKRKKVWELYMTELKGSFPKVGLQISSRVIYNYAYFPLLMKDEKELGEKNNDLKKEGILARRYFYPSLHKLPHYSYRGCKVSEDISKRIFCLPLYEDLKAPVQRKIIDILNK